MGRAVVDSEAVAEVSRALNHVEIESVFSDALGSSFPSGAPTGEPAKFFSQPPTGLPTLISDAPTGLPTMVNGSGMPTAYSPLTPQPSALPSAFPSVELSPYPASPYPSTMPTSTHDYNQPSTALPSASPLSYHPTAPAEDLYPEGLLQHHSLREVQIVSLSVAHQFEIQVRQTTPSHLLIIRYRQP